MYDAYYMQYQTFFDFSPEIEEFCNDYTKIDDFLCIFGLKIIKKEKPGYPGFEAEKPDPF